MARRTTFCPVSENLSVIEPRSITVFHSNLDASSIHGLTGRSYRFPRLLLIFIMDQFDFYAPLSTPFLYKAPENFERLISECLSYRSDTIMSSRPKIFSRVGID